MTTEQDLPEEPARPEPAKATSIVICNSTTREAYKPGQGEVQQPMRAGAERKFESRGF